MFRGLIRVRKQSSIYIESSKIMRNTSFIKNRLRQLFSFLLAIAVLSGTLPLAAQTRKNVKKNTPKTIAAKVSGKMKTKCSGGWSGTITVAKTLEESGSTDEPLISKKMDRQINKWSYNQRYAGRMVVDGSTDPRAPKAFGSVEYGETRTQQSTTKIWDSCKAVNDQHWMLDENRREEIQTGNGAGAAESFDLSVDELAGTYRFSFKFADAAGKMSVEDHTKRSGHCSAKNNQPSDTSEKRETTIAGEGAVIEDQKFDSQNPDILSGTAKIDTNDYNDPQHVKVPITIIKWKFRRCAAPLMITDLKFSQPQFPSPNSFVEIGENGYAIDGNQVKITATVVNLSGEQKTTNVNFNELTENVVLPGGNKTETFAAHEEKEIELIWDTSGYAWKKDAPYNTAINSRDIEVSIPGDKLHEQISVYPKPVVIVPGMWSKREKLEKFVSLFKNQNVPWTATIARTYVGKKSAENAPIIDQTVREIQKQANA